MYHMIIEQTKDYKLRIEYDPETETFHESPYTSLAYARQFPHPYGWIKESGHPPKAHLDVFLLSNEPYELGDEVIIKIVGCFVRNDGDSKLIAITPNRTETDFSQLPDVEKEDLNRLYPSIGEGEGWFGKEKADEILKAYFETHV